MAWEIHPELLNSEDCQVSLCDVLQKETKRETMWVNKVFGAENHHHSGFRQHPVCNSTLIYVL